MDPERDESIEMYRRMLRIRRFDEATRTLMAAGEIPGPLHASTGQEATAVGACMALRANDFVTGNHRSHGHPIAKGAALAPLMAELLGTGALTLAPQPAYELSPQYVQRDIGWKKLAEQVRRG